jgi:polyisoprenoid-binding protein YceI
MTRSLTHSMIRRLFALIIGLSVASVFTVARAADPVAPPATALDGVPMGKYLLDKQHVSVQFAVNHLGFSSYRGRFNTVDATLLYDKESGVTATIDLNSVDTNNSVLEEKLKSPTFFDTQKYSEARFVSTSFKKLSDSKGTLTGDLSLHGVTRPVTLDVTFNGAGFNPFEGVKTLGFSATTRIKRSNFDMKEYLPAVGDEVTITIEAEFNKEPN